MKGKHIERGAETVIDWLRENEVLSGGVTHHDRACLRACAEVALVWLRGDMQHRKLSAEAFGRLVAQMQFSQWAVAYHVVAHVGDWGHRAQLWVEAGLPTLALLACKFGPESRKVEAGCER